MQLRLAYLRVYGPAAPVQPPQVRYPAAGLGVAEEAALTSTI